MSKKEQSNEHVQVFVRCRPLSKSELNVPVLVEVHPEVNKILTRDSLTDKCAVKSFSFDRVFGPEAKQADVYAEVVAPLIQEVILGFNCTIFAYGQTGTGKTFTIEGARTANLEDISQDPLSGIIPRSMKHLFDNLTEQDMKFEIRVSFLELYNEEIFDLLSKSQDPVKLKIFDNSMQKGSVIVQGLESKAVTSMKEVYSILDTGFKKRRKASTLLNKASSRSHTVFTVITSVKESSSTFEKMKTGKLNLVDLAGSENIGRSGASDKRAREAGNINQSLLALGRVITSLCEKANHIPYRESKLTRLLQDSLGGQTKTAIIATISPSSIHIEETLNTLEYALRAKNIANKPELNTKVTITSLTKDYLVEISRLKRNIYELGTDNFLYMPEENIKYYETTLASKREEKFKILNNISNLTEENKLVLDNTIEEAHYNLNEKNKQLEETKLRYKEYQQMLEKEKEENKLHEAMLQVMQPLCSHMHDKLHEAVEEKEKFESELLKVKEKLKSAANERLNLLEKLKKVRKNEREEKTNLHQSAEKLLKNIRNSHGNINSLTSECNNYVTQLKHSFKSGSMFLESEFTNLHKSLDDLEAFNKSFLENTALAFDEEKSTRLKWIDDFYDAYKSSSEIEVLEPLSNTLNECESSLFGISSDVNDWKNFISSEVNMRQNRMQELLDNQKTTLEDMTECIGVLLRNQNESFKEYSDIMYELKCINSEETSKALWNEQFQKVELALTSLDLFCTEQIQSKNDKTYQADAILKNSARLGCEITEKLNSYCEKSVKNFDAAEKEITLHESNAFSQAWEEMKKSVDVSRKKYTILNTELARIFSSSQDVDGISNLVKDVLQPKVLNENQSISSCFQEMTNSISKCGDSYETCHSEIQAEIDNLLSKDKTHLEKLTETSKLLSSFLIPKVPEYTQYIENEMKSILVKDSTGENRSRTERCENETFDGDITITSADCLEGAPTLNGCEECPVCANKVLNETLHAGENGSQETTIVQCPKNIFKSPVKELKVQPEASGSRSFLSHFQRSPIRRPRSKLPARRHLQFVDFEKLAYQVLQSSSDEDLSK